MTDVFVELEHLAQLHANTCFLKYIISELFQCSTSQIWLQV